MIRKGNNDNHPKKGSSIKVDPIRSLDAIKHIKAHLRHQPRNLCLFTLGINTAYRASELLSITIGDVSALKLGDPIEIKQPKNSEHRITAINTPCLKCIKAWLDHHPSHNEHQSPLFISQRGRSPLTVQALNRLVKSWCKSIDLKGNYGSHTLRKTWGYHQRLNNKASVALLMKAYGHASEAQTLAYLGILPNEIRELYLSLEL